MASAGIINNAAMYPMLTGEALAELNEMGGEANLATGYHAIEFLLWGQDDEMPGTGAGKRPYTDFVTGGGMTASNQARRREYLTAVTDLLVEQLETVRDAWAPNVADELRRQVRRGEGRRAARTTTPRRTPSPRSSSTASARWPAVSCRASA